MPAHSSDSSPRRPPHSTSCSLSYPPQLTHHPLWCTPSSHKLDLETLDLGTGFLWQHREGFSWHRHDPGSRRLTTSPSQEATDPAPSDSAGHRSQRLPLSLAPPLRRALRQLWSQLPRWLEENGYSSIEAQWMLYGSHSTGHIWAEFHHSRLTKDEQLTTDGSWVRPFSRYLKTVLPDTPLWTLHHHLYAPSLTSRTTSPARLSSSLLGLTRSHPPWDGLVPAPLYTEYLGRRISQLLGGGHGRDCAIFGDTHAWLSSYLARTGHQITVHYHQNKGRKTGLEALSQLGLSGSLRGIYKFTEPPPHRCNYWLIMAGTFCGAYHDNSHPIKELLTRTESGEKRLWPRIIVMAWQGPLQPPHKTAVSPNMPDEACHIPCSLQPYLDTLHHGPYQLRQLSGWTHPPPHNLSQLNQPPYQPDRGQHSETSSSYNRRREDKGQKEKAERVTYSPNTYATFLLTLLPPAPI